MPASTVKHSAGGRSHLKRSHEPWDSQSHQQGYCFARDNCSRGLDSNELERIADGVEKMVLSWNQCKEERGREYQRVRNSLDEDTKQYQKEVAKLNEELSPTRARKKLNQIATEVNVSYSPFNSPSKGTCGNIRHDGKPGDASTRSNDGQETYTVHKRGACGDQELQLSLSHRKCPDSNGSKGDAKTCCDLERDCCPTTSGVGGGHEIKLPALDGINFKGLESRLATLNKHCLASSVSFKDKNPPCASTQPPCKEIEDMRIALVETQVQAELKIIEMKLELLRRMQQPKCRPCDLKCEPLALTNFEEDRCELTPRWDCGQLTKLQEEKKTLMRELCALKKRERQFDLQQKNLHCALQRVNKLQRLLCKKEEELVDSQLREKELKNQLDEICCKEQGKTQIEPANFIHLLSSITDWLRSVRKDTSMECTYPDCCRHPECCPHAKKDMHLDCCTTEYTDLLSRGCNQWPTRLEASQINSIIKGLNIEVQALHNQLSQLAKE